MADTNFKFRQTVISSDWMQNVNDVVYRMNNIPATQVGAQCNGFVDDAPALNAAFTAFGAAGGTIYIPFGKQCYIGSNLNIPANCVLKGPRRVTGTPGNNSSVPYGSMGGALKVNSAATISISSNAAVEGLLVYQSVISFPQNNAANFAGTAFTLTGDDAGVFGCIVLGFNKACYANNAQRPRFYDVLGDNNNGIEITQCFDIARIKNCHMWPFVTVAGTGGTAGNQRSGDAYYLHDSVDGPMLDNCFSYGYLNGFHFKNISTIHATGCMADNTAAYGTSVGWLFEGNINGFNGVGNSTWSQSTGIALNLNVGQNVDLAKMQFTGNTTMLNVQSGNCQLHHCELFTGTTLCTVQLASSIVSIDYNTISNITNMVVAANPTSNIYIGPNNTNLTSAAGTSMTTVNVTSRTLVAADPLLLPPYGEVFQVTGTTSFGNLGGGWAGRKVTLQFAGALTVDNGTVNQNSMRLNGAANFTTASGSALTLVHTGVQWFEAGRCS